MNYKVGDAVRIYFFGEKMRVRVFELQAIYESTGLELSPPFAPFPPCSVSIAGMRILTAA